MRASSEAGEGTETLLAATPEAVYRLPAGDAGKPERVLDEPTHGFAVASGRTAVLAATEDGVYRTPDRGDTWDHHGLAGVEVRAVETGTRGETYAGTRPANLHVTRPDDANWRTVEGFRAGLPAETWPTNPHRDAAWVRAIGTPSRAPRTLIAGVEVGGVAVSRDQGDSWEHCPAVPDDVHDVTCVSPTEWVVCCGTGGPDDRGGVFRTESAGADWERLDTGARDYARASCHGSRLYTAANRSPPLWQPPDAAVFVANDEGRLERVRYPGEPESFVISWASADENGRVFAGTNDGWLLEESRGEWHRLGRLPVAPADRRSSGVRALITFP